MKDPLPPLVDDRSIKEAKFRAQGDDGDNSEHLPFQDMLMQSQQVTEDEWTGNEAELILDPKDFVVGNAEDIPFLCWPLIDDLKANIKKKMFY